jgi:uncharacterized protein (TIGR00369 family)
MPEQTLGTDSPIPTMYDQLQMLTRGEIPLPPVDELLGFTWTSVEEGRAVMDVDISARHANGMGTLHGGVLCSLADACMGTAFASTLKEGEAFASLELKINFLKPVWKAKLTATATVVKRGDTIGLVECDVIDENQSLVAKAVSTCMALKDEKAVGRSSAV